MPGSLPERYDFPPYQHPHSTCHLIKTQSSPKQLPKEEGNLFSPRLPQTLPPNPPDDAGNGVRHARTMPRAARPTTGRTRGKPRGLRRDRDCASCRRRDVKCDLNRPRCRPCVEEGLPCGGYPQRVVWASSSAPAATTAPATGVPRERPSRSPEAIKDGWLESNVTKTRPGAAALTPNQANQSASLIERLSAFCQSLSISQQAGQETAVRGPQLASQVDGFLRARLKTQGARPPASSPVDDVRDQDAFEVQRLATLASLKEVLETADPVAFLAIAVFAFFEVVSDGAFGEWQRHLRGARSLLDYHCRDPTQFALLSAHVPGLSEMLAYFNWWDVVGSVIRHLSRSPAGREEGFIFLEWHRGLMDDEFFAAVGCPANTFRLFVSLNEAAPGVAEDRYIQAMGQLLQLGSDQTHQGQCGDAWRCAAAIAVLTWDNPADCGGLLLPRQTALISAVDRICQIVAASPSTSRYYAHMATAVFMAAINASSPEHCRVVETYWQNCQTGELPRYQGARAQCVEIWRSKGIS